MLNIGLINLTAPAGSCYIQLGSHQCHKYDIRMCILTHLAALRMLDA